VRAAERQHASHGTQGTAFEYAKYPSGTTGHQERGTMFVLWLTVILRCQLERSQHIAVLDDYPVPSAFSAEAHFGRSQKIAQVYAAAAIVLQVASARRQTTGHLYDCTLHAATSNSADH